MGDDKSTAAFILARLKPAPKAEEKPKESDEGLHVAMQEFLDALADKDAKAAAKAFHAAFVLCESMPHEEYAGDEEEDEEESE